MGILTNPYSFAAAPASGGFTFEVKTDNTGVSANDEFKIPLVSNGVIDLVVDWGDSTSDVITAWNDAALTHAYAAAGTYTIQITATTGTLRGWTFGWGGDKVKMLDISQWGDFNWTNGSAFTQCANMTHTATDSPTISGNSMQYGFFGCTLWNPATAGDWDVSSVTNLNSLLIFNSAFNQDLDGWDVSNVYDFGGVFYGTLCNFPLPNWDVSSGTSFNQMFNTTPFNQDIDMWDMSSAQSLFSMFYGCSAFNQDLNSWNTISVTSMNSIFNSCTVFDGNISSWNVSSCTNFGSAFQATAFNQDISGWNVSSGTNFLGMFRDATSFNQDISGWNVAAATDMSSMFRNATSFDQDISSWDITSVTNFSSFMQGVTLSTANYDALLIGWDAQSVVSGLTVDFGSSVYTNCATAAAARANLISSDSWTITDGGGNPASCSSPFTFGIVATGSSFTLPLVNDGVIDMDVDWGDGSTDNITAYNDAAVTHAYAGTGAYTIEITGTIRGWRFWWGGSVAQMRDISNWGDFDFTTYGAFAGAGSMTCSATDVPNISGSSLGYSFYSCTVFNGDMTGWSTGAITDMNGMFTLCNAFTGVGMVGWDVSNSTGFSSLFYGSLFNQDISGWNTSSLQNMGQMFTSTPFNQDIGSWDVSGVTNMGAVFQQATAFNQDISSWDTANVVQMNDMFYNCSLFNADISGWDVSRVTNFQNTFNNCTAFDQDLSSWNLGLCTRTIGMFQYATSFNSNISGWNVSNVTYMNNMFYNATSFNQAIGVWSTGNVTNMTSMLRQCAAFDQDLGGWDITSVTDLTSVMLGTTLSTANYDALLIGWDAQAVVSGLTPNFGSSTYTLGGTAATARANLISSDSWTITDGGGV